MMQLIATPFLGTAQSLIAIGPEVPALAVLGVLALVWIGRGMAEDARRMAARSWTPRIAEPATDPGPRLAA